MRARPNIVLILADDMGYGDPRCYNPESQCVTPHIDRLAREGMRFTDAHSAGGVCVPSRYGLLTGRYPFRTQLSWRNQAVIPQERGTLATLLKSAEYRTAMVGKWHLGFDDGPNHDYSQPLVGGPVDRGFDTYFGMPASLDIPPYFYIRDRHAVLPPTDRVAASATEGWSPIQGAFWREGGIAPNFRHDEVLDRFAEEAVSVIDTHGTSREPLFLYLALPAPHTPWLPADRFWGSGGAGLYSEFVAHVDEVVGRVLQSLDENQLAGNTLVLFSSDNGPVWYDADEEKFHHLACGPHRGMKGDAWEGGHRVPVLARWPDQVPAGTTCDHLLGFVDVMATFADLVESPLESNAGEDSVSFLGSLLGTAERGPRQSMVHHHQADCGPAGRLEADYASRLGRIQPAAKGLTNSEWPPRTTLQPRDRSGRDAQLVG